MGDDVVIVDVRLPSDYRKAHVPGAVNLPNGKWHTATGLARDKLNILYCYSQTCHRGGLGNSDRSLSGWTAIFSDDSRRKSDETTPTQSLTGIQGAS
ncbi:MAG: rhodanese-like domain-containing protein, partial [Gammaproteobacteria bacterium]